MSHSQHFTIPPSHPALHAAVVAEKQTKALFSVQGICYLVFSCHALSVAYLKGVDLILVGEGTKHILLGCGNLSLLDVF